MKKVFLIALVSIGMTAFAAPTLDVNQKVLEAFHDSFSKVKDSEVTWHEFDHFYQAQFMMGTINIRVNYDKDGNVLSTLRYYSEHELPPHIIAKLHKRYEDKSVFGVTEVSNPNNIKYVITLEDDTHWSTIESDAFGDMVRTNKFRKA